MTSDAATAHGASGPMTLGPADLDDVLALNQAWVPHVGALDRDRLVSILDTAELAATVRGTDGALAGFVIVLGPGASYDSPNYAWFAERHNRFTYVDRIAVAAEIAGAGIGRRLYEHVADHARTVGSPVVCAEVNLDPPNPDSLAFHARMGFQPVGTQWTYDDTVEVQMQEWQL